jgi:hypothetical protein
MTEALLLVLFGLVTLWAVAATVLLLWFPKPLRDRGHRTFGVKDRKAQAVVGTTLETLGGLPPRFHFTLGFTDQLVLSDASTVLHLLDECVRTDPNLTGTGISVVVKDPEESARAAVRLLQESGFQAEVLGGMLGKSYPVNHLAIVNSDAFLGWVLVFRVHGRYMDEIPGLEWLSVPRS